jgi:SH3 domain protein
MVTASGDNHQTEPTSPSVIIMNARPMTAKSLLYIIVCAGLNLAAQPLLAETLYVSDELTIPLRSGDTSQHRIIKFLPSGAKLEILDTNEAGSYQLVRTTSGKQGWVEAKKLMKSASARSQLPKLSKRIAKLKTDIRQKNETIAELKASISDLQNQNSKLDGYGQRQSDELARLKKVAARPVQLAQQNSKLETDLAKTNRELDRALAENADLSNNNIKEWFMIGGGVSLISLLFGLVIPNFKWRRKTDSWGGGF